MTFELRVSTVRIEGSVTEADIWKLSHPVTNHPVTMKLPIRGMPRPRTPGLAVRKFG